MGIAEKKVYDISFFDEIDMRSSKKDVIVIVPAYEPDGKLIDVYDKVMLDTNYKMVIVDDGSSAKCKGIFDSIIDKDSESKGFVYKNNSDIVKYMGDRLVILKHLVNHGKGVALKTAFEFIKNNFSYEVDIVTVAADGEHKISDVKKVCRHLRSCDNDMSLVTGARLFIGDVPFRSRFGNAVTRGIFNLSAHVKLSDTQTGLRAFSSKLIPFMLGIEGARYEYEMNVLLECTKKKINIEEVEIRTKYTDNSPVSHFRIIKDSCIICKDIIKFSLSSFTCFLFDYMIYSLLLVLSGGSVILSNIFARIFSSGLNFFINVNFVFENKENVLKKAIQYFSLAASILFINSILLNGIIATFGVNKYVAKVLVEMVMFFVNMTVQKFIIFRNKEELDYNFEEKFN